MDATYLRSKEFRALSYIDQTHIIYANLSWLEVLSPASISVLTTSILRAFCGCSDESVLDESTGEWIQLEGHGPDCLRKRFPIEEDLSDRTIERRKYRCQAMSPEMMLLLEERKYGA